MVLRHLPRGTRHKMQYVVEQHPQSVPPFHLDGTEMEQRNPPLKKKLRTVVPLLHAHAGMILSQSCDRYMGVMMERWNNGTISEKARRKPSFEQWSVPLLFHHCGTQEARRGASRRQVLSLSYNPTSPTIPSRTCAIVINSNYRIFPPDSFHFYRSSGAFGAATIAPPLLVALDYDLLPAS